MFRRRSKYGGRTSAAPSNDGYNTGIPTPSAAAAAAASRSFLAPQAAAEALRRHSLDQSGADAIAAFPANGGSVGMRRTASMTMGQYSRQPGSGYATRPPPRNSSVGSFPRSNSMTRTNSLTRSSTVVNRDNSGRTMSLTTTTVRQMGSFEITTQKETVVARGGPRRPPSIGNMRSAQSSYRRPPGAYADSVHSYDSELAIVEEEPERGGSRGGALNQFPSIYASPSSNPGYSPDIDGRQGRRTEFRPVSEEPEYLEPPRQVPTGRSYSPAKPALRERGNSAASSDDGRRNRVSFAGADSTTEFVYESYDYDNIPDDPDAEDTPAKRALAAASMAASRARFRSDNPKTTLETARANVRAQNQASEASYHPAPSYVQSRTYGHSQASAAAQSSTYTPGPSSVAASVPQQRSAGGSVAAAAAAQAPQRAEASRKLRDGLDIEKYYVPSAKVEKQHVIEPEPAPAAAGKVTRTTQPIVTEATVVDQTIPEPVVPKPVQRSEPAVSVSTPRPATPPPSRDQAAAVYDEQEGSPEFIDATPPQPQAPQQSENIVSSSAPAQGLGVGLAPSPHLGTDPLASRDSVLSTADQYEDSRETLETTPVASPQTTAIPPSVLAGATPERTPVAASPTMTSGKFSPSYLDASPSRLDPGRQAISNRASSVYSDYGDDMPQPERTTQAPAVNSIREEPSMDRPRLHPNAAAAAAATKVASSTPVYGGPSGARPSQRQADPRQLAANAARRSHQSWQPAPHQQQRPEQQQPQFQSRFDPRSSSAYSARPQRLSQPPAPSSNAQRTPVYGGPQSAEHQANGHHYQQLLGDYGLQRNSVDDDAASISSESSFKREPRQRESFAATSSGRTYSLRNNPPGHDRRSSTQSSNYSRQSPVSSNRQAQQNGRTYSLRDTPRPDPAQLLNDADQRGEYLMSLRDSHGSKGSKISRRQSSQKGSGFRSRIHESDSEDDSPSFPSWGGRKSNGSNGGGSSGGNKLSLRDVFSPSTDAKTLLGRTSDSIEPAPVPEKKKKKNVFKRLLGISVK